MTDNNNNFFNEDDEIDLYQLISVLWSFKKLIFSVTLIAAVFSVIYSLSIPNTYRSEALVTTAQDQGGLSSSLGSFGGLASLAGINLPAGGNDAKKTEAIAILSSRQFLESFIVNHDLLVPIMAASGWDKETNQLKINPNIYDMDSKKWVSRTGEASSPSMQEAIRQFRTLVQVSTGSKNMTNYLNIHVDSYSPHIAKQWVDWMIEDINEYMMLEAVSRATKSLEYLNLQMGQTNISEIKNILSELIKSETQTIMLSKSSSEYMFKTIDKAIIPELKIKPYRSIMCMIGTFVGGILGVLLALFINYTGIGMNYLSKNK